MLLLPILLAFTAAHADDQPSLVVRVNRAIDRGAAQLVREQQPDGSWNKGDKAHPLGRTALCTFALLHAGYPEDHEAVKKALAFLRVDGYAHWKKPISTYEAGCLALMLNALGRQHGAQIREICQWLCDNFSWNAGLWGYPGGVPDLSNTQYAVLALKVGEKHGFKTPKKIWKRLIDTVIQRMQSPTGGMRYRPGTIYRGSMTHAGCLTLLFAYQGMGMKSPPPNVKVALRKAHRWFEESYSVERHPSGRDAWTPGHFYYYMYGLERYAIFFGFDEIAGHDWYREGAEVLIERQGRRGAWGRLEETCFAILFLRKATFSRPKSRLVADGGDDDGRDRPQRPRPEEGVSYLRDWLVAGPYCGEKREDDHLFEKHLSPKRTVPVVGGPAGKMAWVRYSSEEDKIDLAVATRGMAWASWYAATYLYTDKERSAVLWCDSDDGLRVWLNGEEILFGHHHGHCGHDFYRVPVKLRKGRNILLLQVENLEHYAYFKARLSDEKGWPVTGVKSSTRPTAPKKR